LNRAARGFDESEEDDDVEEIDEQAPYRGGVCPPRLLCRANRKAADLVERSRKLLERMHQDDREEAIDLHERIGTAIESGDAPALAEASRALKELVVLYGRRAN